MKTQVLEKAKNHKRGQYFFVKTLWSLGLALSPFLTTFAQVTVEWSNDPGGVAVTTDQLQNVYSANWDYNPGGDITLTKRTTAGEVLWNVSYDNTDNTRHEVVTWIACDSDNNCLVAGTIRSGFSNPVNAASLLMKFDPDGNLIWRNVFESSFEGSSTSKILIDANDAIYVLGLGMGSNGMVTRVKKFDATGATVWTYYDAVGVGAPRNIKFTPDNALIVSAKSITGNLNGFFKLTTDGTLIWSKTGIISQTIGDAAGDASGNSYLINGENILTNPGSVLQKLGPDGALIWADTNAMAGSRVEVGSDNYPIISGFPNAGTGGAAFMKFDTDGAMLWENLNADGPEILLLHGQLILDANNNAYLSAGNLFNMAVCKINADGTSGWVGLVSGSNSAKSFTVASDNAVYLIGTTTAKLFQNSNTNNLMDVASAELVIAPNPFQLDFTVFTENTSGDKTIRIYDSSGHLMYTSSFVESIKTIQLPDLPSGAYFLTLTDQNGVYHRKIIKT